MVCVIMKVLLINLIGRCYKRREGKKEVTKWSKKRDEKCAHHTNCLTLPYISQTHSIIFHNMTSSAFADTKPWKNNTLSSFQKISSPLHTLHHHIHIHISLSLFHSIWPQKTKVLLSIISYQIYFLYILYINSSLPQQLPTHLLKIQAHLLYLQHNICIKQKDIIY